MKVVLAGGSGALGRALARAFSERGDEVVTLTRSPGQDDGPGREVRWDGRTVGDWAAEIEGAALINLAGELVDRRPTPENVELLTKSRVEPTLALAEASRSVDTPPAVWAQASTLAIYGEGGDTVLDEAATPADGPPQMAGVAKAWEQASAGGVAGRFAVMRIGVVLERDTPAFNRLAGITRWGLGGRTGSGRQWVSWIHIDDFIDAVLRIVDDASLNGVVHVTSPNPVRNSELMASLRRALHRPPAPPAPAPLVRVGAFLMRTDPALALLGRRGVPAALESAGFEFRYPTLDEALAAITR